MSNSGRKWMDGTDDDDDDDDGDAMYGGAGDGCRPTLILIHRVCNMIR